MTLPTESSTEFRQLLADARGGSTDALGRLLASFRTRLLSQACREIDGEVAGKFGASDAVQDTFLKAQRGFDGFAGNDEDALLAWLRRVLRNHLSNLRRTYQTDKRSVSREHSLDHSARSLLRTPVPASPQSTPSSICVRVEETAALEVAMENLPDDYREVIRMRYWDGQQFSVIADRLNRSPEAARKLWARAMIALQRELDR